MKKAIAALGLLAALVVAGGAWAESGGAARGPCVRSGVAAADEMGCELAVVRSERAAAQERIEKVLAAANLLASDLAAAREGAAKREADLAAWFKGEFPRP